MKDLETQLDELGLELLDLLRAKECPIWWRVEEGRLVIGIDQLGTLTMEGEVALKAGGKALAHQLLLLSQRRASPSSWVGVQFSWDDGRFPLRGSWTPREEAWLRFQRWPAEREGWSADRRILIETGEGEEP